MQLGFDLDRLNELSAAALAADPSLVLVETDFGDVVDNVNRVLVPVRSTGNSTQMTAASVRSLLASAIVANDKPSI